MTAPRDDLVAVLADVADYLARIEEYMDGRADADADDEGRSVGNAEMYLWGELTDNPDGWRVGLITRVEVWRERLKAQGEGLAVCACGKEHLVG